ncbi:hypothetical protein PIB30_031309 [Stylosanthes scabra]|uniref:Uncharacterized protein n=1 Tax=Stylosanthes scabra TaxID=79078 RepID=A0ABU6RCB2_9FABA|nr:hypothetical protein [Stylosanthes scabra]
MENSIVKARVCLDVTQPLRRSLKIAGTNLKHLQIGIKYERIEDTIKDEIKEEQWAEWLRSEQGGRRVSVAKENLPPNNLQRESSTQNNQCKPIPNTLQPNLVFAASTANSPNAPKKLSLKKQARRRLVPVTGIKRGMVEDMLELNHKKHCSDENVTAEEGEGATPQWAPKDP